MLNQLLKMLFYVTLYEANDNFENTKQNTASLVRKVLVSSGISVGDYDFVAQALKRTRVKTLFYK
jgi:molybdopterin molybdotransferase